MGLLRKGVVLVVVCLMLGASAVSAAVTNSSPVHREAGAMARFLDQLGAFLKAVWENQGWEIDTLGGKPAGATGDAPATPDTDEGWQIDPLG